MSEHGYLGDDPYTELARCQAVCSDLRAERDALKQQWKRVKAWVSRNCVPEPGGTVLFIGDNDDIAELANIVKEAK